MISLVSDLRAEDVRETASEAEPDDARLVRETLDANPRAFDQLVRLHTRRVFNYVNQMTRNAHDAEDVTQQTFIKAFHNLHRFDTSRPLINWLLTIARRTTLNHFRASKRWEEMPAETASNEPTPATTAEERDGTENIWAQARRLLSPRDYEILWLRFGEQLSTAETARVVGLTETHVKVLLHRARQQLQKGVPRT